MKPSFVQRRYLLWDTVQPRFLAVNVAHQGVVFLTFAASLFVPLMMKLHNLPLASPEAATIGYQFTVLHDSIWPAFPIALVLIVIHSVFFSHRIAGPLYRFRNVFKALSRGDLTVSTTIRKGDYLQQEAGNLGEMVGELRSKISRIESDCQMLQGTVSELKQKLEGESSKAAQEVLARLEQQAQHLTADVRQFQLQREPKMSSHPNHSALAA
jgi:methyl-accepting chemotaxis protein